MSNNPYLQKYFSTIYEMNLSINMKKFYTVVGLIKNLKKKNKIIIVGNGGSASIANHVAVDFSKILKKRSITFNEPNLITCYANDYGHDNWMREALKSYALRNDILILISSSGESKNILNCAKQAKKMKLKLITFSGFKFKNKLRAMGLVNFWADSKSYNIVEITHQTWLLSICDYIKKTKL